MPITPLIVYGTLVDEDSNILVNQQVKACNNTSKERTSTITDSQGKYLLDLANFSNGYVSGDNITVYIRNNGYVGESSFDVSDQPGENVNLVSANQVTFATLHNTVWKSVYDTLQNGTFSISTDNIYSAMNDHLIKDVGYPIVILSPPLSSRNGITFNRLQTNNEIVITVDVYHTSSESLKVLADEVIYSFMRAQEVWDGLGLHNIMIDNNNYDTWMETGKKIHFISFDVTFQFDGVISVP